MKKTLLWTLAIAGALFLAQSGIAAAGECSPGTLDQEAGPIWDQADAEQKCPKVCADPPSLRSPGSWGVRLVPDRARLLVWGDNCSGGEVYPASAAGHSGF
jgi:hypothetical protein